MSPEHHLFARLLHIIGRAMSRNDREEWCVLMEEFLEGDAPPTKIKEWMKTGVVLEQMQKSQIALTKKRRASR